MKQPATKEICNVEVEFYDATAGWLCYKITAGYQVFESAFSHVFDPLIDLKIWLEALSIGVQQASFTLNPEGDDIKFDLDRITWESEVLTISEIYDQGEIFINTNVKRNQVVKAFYLGLLNFAASDKFKSDQWEIVLIKERLCEKLKVNETQLINILADLDKKELGEILFMADPSYQVVFPTAKDTSEEINWFVQETVQGNETHNDHIRLEFPDEWPMPEEYDFWPLSKKTEYIHECINDHTSGYTGTKIKDFRSETIEKYLDKQIEV